MSSIGSADAAYPAVAVTGADYLECAKLYGLATANTLLEYGKSVLDVNRRCSFAHSAFARAAGSAGSSGSSSGGPLVGRPAGLTGARLESIRRVDSWRPSGVIGTSSGVPDGMCYSKLLCEEVAKKSSVVLRVGEWPTFGSLVRRGVGDFKSLADLERFRLERTGDGVAHVRAGGVAGVKFLDAVSSYSKAIKCQPGTLARAVLDSRSCVDRVPWVTGSLRVGGETGGGGSVGSTVGFSFLHERTARDFHESSGAVVSPLLVDEPFVYSRGGRWVVQYAMSAPGDAELVLGHAVTAACVYRANVQIYVDGVLKRSFDSGLF